jgi:hypothetical protein
MCHDSRASIRCVCARAHDIGSDWHGLVVEPSLTISVNDASGDSVARVREVEPQHAAERVEQRADFPTGRRRSRSPEAPPPISRHR